jgi:hypothetical protein
LASKLSGDLGHGRDAESLSGPVPHAPTGRRSGNRLDRATIVADDTVTTIPALPSAGPGRGDLSPWHDDRDADSKDDEKAPTLSRRHADVQVRSESAPAVARTRRATGPGTIAPTALIAHARQPKPAIRGAARHGHQAAPTGQVKTVQASRWHRPTGEGFLLGTALGYGVGALAVGAVALATGGIGLVVACAILAGTTGAGIIGGTAGSAVMPGNRAQKKHLESALHSLHRAGVRFTRFEADRLALVRPAQWRTLLHVSESRVAGKEARQNLREALVWNAAKHGHDAVAAVKRDLLATTLPERIRGRADATRLFVDGYLQIRDAGLDAGGRAAAIENLKVAIEEQPRTLRPLDETFVDNAAQACIEAERSLQEANLDGDRRLDPGRREQIRGFYRASVATAIRNGAPLAEDACRALLDNLVALHGSKVPDERRAATLATYTAAVHEQLRWQRPVDAGFLQQTGRVCIAAERSLQEANLDADGLTDAARDEIRSAYRAITTTAIKRGDPLFEETRRALLHDLAAIRTDQQPEESRKAAFDTFVDALRERQHLGGTVNVGQTRKAAVLTEQVLAQAKLDQERDVHPKSMAELKKAYRLIVRARLEVDRPLSQDELRQTLETLKTGMRWTEPASDDEVADRKEAADRAADQLVARLLERNPREADLVGDLQSAYTSSRFHTVSRYYLGIKYDGQPDERNDGSRRVGPANRDEILEDLAQRISEALNREGLTAEEAERAYDRLMAEDGKASALMVATDVLGATRALTEQDPQHGYLALVDLNGALTLGLKELARKAAVPVDRVDEDLRRHRQVTSSSFDPEKKARAFIDRLIPAHNRQDQDPAERERQTRQQRRQLIAQYRNNPDYMAIQEAPFDLDAPPLDDQAWQDLRLTPDALERAKSALLDNWPRSHAEFTSLLDLTHDHRNPRVAQRNEQAKQPGAAQDSEPVQDRKRSQSVYSTLSDDGTAAQGKMGPT